MLRPQPDDDHDGFMRRCMGEAGMLSEFPDDPQRASVCQAQWDEMHGRGLPADREYRACFEGLEIRAEGGRPPRLAGYAAIFNSPSSDLGGFTEIVRPGAFSRSLREHPDVLALLHHDPRLILGRGTGGTLRLGEDTRGLWVEIIPAETQIGRDTLENVRVGNLKGMSFGFRARQPGGDAWSDSFTKRELRDVNLFDVSVTAAPAYPKTEIALRSLEQARATHAQGLDEARRRLETARRRVRLADLERKG
jgi:HK97 family phage prohead protease